MHFSLINYVPIDPRKSKWALKQLFLVKYWTSSLTGRIDCRKQFVSSQDKMLIVRICREQNMTTSSTLLCFINSGKLCLIIMEVSQPSCWTWKLWDSTRSCSSIYMPFSFLFYFFWSISTALPKTSPTGITWTVLNLHLHGQMVWRLIALQFYQRMVGTATSDSK